MKTWRDKALKIVDELCVSAYRQSKIDKKPYLVPVDADFLIDCLNRDDEVSAKAHFYRMELLASPIFS